MSLNLIIQMKKSTLSNIILYGIGILLFLLIWEIVSITIGQNSYLLPGPIQTLKYSFKLLQSEYTYQCIMMSLIRMIEGFFISFVLAFVVGVVAGNVETIKRILQPTMVVLRTIPTACLIYLFIVLAGFKDAPIYLVTLVSFPILYEGVTVGIASLSSDLKDALKISQANFIEENLRVRIPLAKSYILTSIISSFSLSFKIEIMAEVITGGSNPGLGNVIQGVRAYNPTNLLPVFSYSLIAIVLMLFIDFVIGLIKLDNSL